MTYIYDLQQICMMIGWKAVRANPGWYIISPNYKQNIFYRTYDEAWGAILAICPDYLSLNEIHPDMILAAQRMGCDQSSMTIDEFGCAHVQFSDGMKKSYENLFATDTSGAILEAFVEMANAFYGKPVKYADR